MCQSLTHGTEASMSCATCLAHDTEDSPSQITNAVICAVWLTRGTRHSGLYAVCLILAHGTKTYAVCVFCAVCIPPVTWHKDPCAVWPIKNTRHKFGQTAYEPFAGVIITWSRHAWSHVCWVVVSDALCLCPYEQRSNNQLTTTWWSESFHALRHKDSTTQSQHVYPVI